MRAWAIAAAVLLAAGCGGASSTPVAFDVTVANVSEPGALATSDGGAQNILFAPGVWAVYAEDVAGALFEPGELAPGELRALAEDGNNAPLAQRVFDDEVALEAGTFGAVDEDVSYEENPIMPGEEVTFDFTAPPGSRLCFAAMFIQSNDVFVGPADGALPLFDDGGKPVDADVTEDVRLWDAGTEVNQEPGLGPTQAPRQPEPGAGEDESEPVSEIDGVDAAGYSYPALPSMLRVTVTPQEP